MMRLEDIEARLKAATPGPWEPYENGIRCSYPSRRDPAWKDWITVGLSAMPIVGKSKLNQDFIAHAPTDIAYLLSLIAVVRRLSSSLDNIQNDKWAMTTDMKYADCSIATVASEALTESERILHGHS